MATTIEEKAVALGAKPWSPNSGPVRYYFNDLEQYLGLEVQRYGTGNINHATLNGEKISNNYASKILISLARAKVWLCEGTIYSKDLGTFSDVVIEGITNALNTL